MVDCFRQMDSSTCTGNGEIKESVTRSRLDEERVAWQSIHVLSGEANMVP
jgi:hypothetical protein